MRRAFYFHARTLDQITFISMILPLGKHFFFSSLQFGSGDSQERVAVMALLWQQTSYIRAGNMKHPLLGAISAPAVNESARSAEEEGCNDAFNVCK